MRMLPSKPATWVGLALLLVIGQVWAGPPLPPPPGTNLPRHAPDPPAPPSDQNADTPDSDSTFDNLDVIDPSLKGRLAILRVGSEPSPNNLLTVFAGFKNLTAHTLKIEVQTIYKDAMGTPLNSGSWIVVTLKPLEEKEYRSASISQQFDPNAVNPQFLIRVRRASTSAAAAN